MSAVDASRVRALDSAGPVPDPKRLKAASGKKEAAPAVTVNGFALPADWPRPGAAIDLDVHDLPHASSAIEWWYVNTHVTAAGSGKEYSAFASFFRYIKSYDKATGAKEYCYALSWAVVDPQEEKYYTDPRVDPVSPDVIKKQLDDGGFVLDARLKRAFHEVCAKGAVPLPDRMLAATECPTDRLAVQLDENAFVKQEDGAYLVSCRNADGTVALELRFENQKPVTRHGHDGVVKIGLKGEDMMYYFVPRCGVTGTLTVPGEGAAPVEVRGQGWYDHEFGGVIKSEEEKEQSQDKQLDYAWNWAAIQLDDGTDISATTVVDTTQPQSHVVLDNFAVMVDAAGARHEHNDDAVVLQPLDSWTSVRTTCSYPTRWRLSIPAAGVELTLDAAFREQEIITLISKPAFWEGRLRVEGTVGGRPVKGLAFVERHGFQDKSSLEVFFKKISKCVQAEIAKVLPLSAERDAVLHLVADEKNEHYLDGADLQVFTDTVVRPIREIVDRGGKSWRSYGLLLCIDVCGGNSEKFKHWLAMPEIMHVGSLIVDDIQDKSEIRRGGPTCHKIHGEALAINAGTAAYFVGLSTLLRLTPGLSAEVQLKIYNTYFLTLRAGHSGQAFDINGLDYQMEGVVESGDNRRLLSTVTCTHRLKSAVPAGNLARIGAIVGGGTDAQVDALGAYFEAIGIAFQVIDDVLNLRGFKGKGKERGEDLREGKVTYPVAVAMAADRLSLEQRRSMWQVIQSKPQDQAVVEELIELIESCGALDESVRHASVMVEEAWKLVDVAIPDSYYKLNLRAFAFFVLERHY